MKFFSIPKYLGTKDHMDVEFPWQQQKVEERVEHLEERRLMAHIQTRGEMD